MNRINGIAHVLCAAAAVVLIFAPQTRATSGTPTWTFSPVGTVPQNFYASSPVLAFDHYGTPSISWSIVSDAAATNVVRHSQLTNFGNWSNRDVVSGANLGLRTAIAFDRAERPAITWINGDGTLAGQFNYGTVQTIASGVADVNRPTLSMSYDIAGNLRGAFTGTTTGNLLAINYSGGSFAQSPVAAIPGVSLIMDSVIATNHLGLRSVASRATLSGGSQAMFLTAEPAGGPWLTTTFATADEVNGVDMAIDPADGRPAVAYTTYDFATDTYKLMYTKFSGLTPQTTTLRTGSTSRYRDVSLAFDGSDGRPAIAFEEQIVASGAQKLMYTYAISPSQWNSVTVDDTVQHNAFNNHTRKPSLAFDDYGTSWPAIAYIDGDGSLMVAFDPPAPEPATAILVAVGAAVLIRSRRCRRSEKPRPPALYVVKRCQG